VEADRGKDAVVLLCEPDGMAGGVEVSRRADGGHAGDAGLFGAEDNLVEFAGVAVFVEVTVCIEEGRHGRLAFAAFAAAGGCRSTTFAAATPAAAPPAPALATSRHLFGARCACIQQIIRGVVARLVALCMLVGEDGFGARRPRCAFGERRTGAALWSRRTGRPSCAFRQRRTRGPRLAGLTLRTTIAALARLTGLTALPLWTTIAAHSGLTTLPLRTTIAALTGLCRSTTVTTLSTLLPSGRLTLRATLAALHTLAARGAVGLAGLGEHLLGAGVRGVGPEVALYVCCAAALAACAIASPRAESAAGAATVEDLHLA
jgi:hypothetical protein